MKKWLRLCGLLVGFVISDSALADVSLPLYACTNYSAKFLSTFDSCADFSVTRGGNRCYKTKGACPACIVYAGDNLQMWLPDYFVELTPHVGRSLFAESTAGAALKLHLTAAKKWWDKSFPAVPTTSNGRVDDSTQTSVWHARILPVPFGAITNTYPPLASSKGAGIPTCYTSLSELIPNQWKYGTADAPYAVALGQKLVEHCLLNPGTSIAAEAISRLAPKISAPPSVGNVGSDIPNGCARPIFDSEAVLKNITPSSDVWNPAKMCIGSLGPLVPRVGDVQTSDPFNGALTAGVKFASLTADFFGDNVTAGWKVDDKWQLIYPPSPHNGCFRPGQLGQIAHLPTGVVEDFSERAKREISGLKADVRAQVYVFAVWRKRESCQEPLGSTFWQISYKTNKEKNSNICKTSAKLK